MRGFLTGVCFYLYFFIAPLAVFSYLVNSFTAPDYIKGKLGESKIYEAAAKSVPQLVELPEDVKQQMPQEAEDLKAFLVKEVTAEYLKNKAESTIGPSYDWLSGKSETVPSISLVDLKGKIETFAQAEGLSLTDEVEKNFSKPIELIKPDQNAQKIRSGFQLFQKSLLILGVGCIILLVLIFLLAESWKSRLRKLSLAFFVPGFLGLLTIIPILFLFTLINGAVSDRLKEPGWAELVSSVKTLLSSISTDVFERMLMIYGGAIALAIILFVAEIFVGNKAKEQPKTSSVNQKVEKPSSPNPAA